MMGLGEYCLRPEYAKHRVTAADWTRMTEAQQLKAREHCFRLPVRGNPVTSTDGTLTVNSALSRGRKPHQRKRPAADTFNLHGFDIRARHAKQLSFY